MKRTFPLDDTCVLWLPFYLHGLENTKMLDYSQYHNDGTRHGAVPTENGWYFDGVDDYIDCGNDTSLDITNMSISAWVNLSEFKTQRIVFKGSAYNVFAYLLQLRGDTWLQFSVGNNIAGDFTSVTTGNYSLNKWQHITATYDGSFLKMYKDGVFVSQISTTQTVSANTNHLTIGADSYGTSYFHGSIGDVKVFNRTLSQEEIQSMYNKERKIFGV